MRLIIIALSVLFFSRNIGYSQVQIKPVIKTSYSYMLNFGGSSYYGYDVSAGGGTRIKDQTTILLQVNYLRCSRYDKNDKFDAFQMLTTSLSVSYRFLKKIYNVSPVLELDAGLNTWSNADGLYLRRFVIHDKPDISYSKFYDNSIIGKTKLLLNVNIKSVDLNIGASYNTYFFHLSGVKGGSVYSLEKGIGFEAQVLYTFPMKKRSLDKLENRNKKVVE